MKRTSAEMFDLTYRWAGERVGARMAGRATSDRPEPSLPIGTVLAVLMAFVVIAIPIGVVLLGLWAISASWPFMPGVVVGVAIVFVGIAFRPRVGGTPPETVDARVPALRRLIDEVHSELGGPAIRGVAVDVVFNASYVRLGFRRRPYLVVGIPLLLALGPQERVALIGHEVAHGLGKDSIRHLVIETALRTLTIWAWAFEPSMLQMDMDGNVVVVTAGEQALFVYYLTHALAMACRGAFTLLLHLTWMDLQRGEYRADRRARRIAGTAATAACLDDLRLSKGFTDVLHLNAIRDQTGLAMFREFQQRLAMGAVGRDESDAFRLDSTHPPIASRVAAIRTKDIAPTIRLSNERSRAIDEELEPFLDPAGRRALAEVREELYGEG